MYFFKHLCATSEAAREELLKRLEQEKKQVCLFYLLTGRPSQLCYFIFPVQYCFENFGFDIVLMYRVKQIYL